MFVGIRREVLVREEAFEDLNNSQEQPLKHPHNDQGLLPLNKANRRRIFSSAGNRKQKFNKPRNRIQTAKYINNVNRAVNNRWRGGSQLQTHKQKGKVSSAQSKYSDKRKKKKIPLGEYDWPDNKNPPSNYNRPVTAAHPTQGAGNRGQINYDERRRNIQSRGRVNATGLSGTSQSSQVQDGTPFP